MAFGVNDQETILNEGKLYIGTWMNPNTIGNGTTGDPKALFVGEEIGIIKKGTLNPQIARALAKLYRDTPGELQRADITQKDYMIECEIQQYNADLIELLTRAITQKNYQGTADSGIYDINHIGTQEDNCTTSPNFGLMILRQRQDCKEIGMAMYNGIMTSESISFQVADDYLSLAFKAEATPHPDFAETFPGTGKNLGSMWIVQQAA